MRTQNTVNFLQRGKNLPLFKKIMYIIKRGKENILLFRSIFVHTCGLDRLQAGRLFSKTEIQKAGKRIERDGNRQRNYNYSEVFFQELNKQLYSRGNYGP